MDVLQHAAVGAFVTGGGLTAAQSLLARRLKAPSSLALSLGSFVGVFRLLEVTGRKFAAENGERTPNASHAAAVAAAVALVMLDNERKTVVVSYAVVEAALSLINEFTSLADSKSPAGGVGRRAADRLLDLPERRHRQVSVGGAGQLLPAAGECAAPHARRDPSGKLVSRCDVFHRETDDRQRLARLPLERRLIQRSGAVLQLDLSTCHFPQVSFLEHHRHLELPRVEVGSVELVDARGRGRGSVHGESVVGVFSRENGAWAHNQKEGRLST
ncbi:hypothetical protein ON010_g7900 [Phytophthora cinnamomi]|nr:hypothetical protein ON010_g7900 [Phytophthora cinnamomi]